MKVLVAMSGGVDSSVAAALMRDQGHEVIGVTLKLWEGPDGQLPTAGCCTVSDAEDARRVAAQLDIPYYVLNYTSSFRQAVVDHFIDDYLHGRTPNPCIECNRTVKFDQLLRQAAEFDCELVVTGHYARTDRVDGRWRLLRGVDPAKDQSYVLSMLTQTELTVSRFPVGDLEKSETRSIAAGLGLRTATKPDSQDICFVGNDDYRDFVARRVGGPAQPGPIVDAESNEVVGHHAGITGFTVGQRRGIGVAVGAPRYVVDVDPTTAVVTIGRRERLAVSTVLLTDVTWVSDPPSEAAELGFQFRAHGSAHPCHVEAGGTEAKVRLVAPVHAVAPGQTGALYRADEVVGAGIIESTS